MTDQPLHDEATLAFYDREAGAYAARKDQAGPHLIGIMVVIGEHRPLGTDVPQQAGRHPAVFHCD